MSLKLSVVVPVYNSSKYLCKCIDSILNQTYSDLELILVDDGSMDESGAICDTYAEKDRRIKVVHKNNEGLIRARLSGVENANGEFVTFVDGDDWIASDTYEQMMGCIGSSDVVVAGIYRYYAENEINMEHPMLQEGRYDKKAVENFIIPYMLWSRKRNTWELDPSLCTKIFRKNMVEIFLKNARELDIYFGEDTSVIFPLMLKVNSAVIMHNCYYYHRQRQQGIIPLYFQDSRFFERLYLLFEYLQKEFLQSEYWGVLCPQLEHFYVNAVQLKQKSFFDYNESEEDVFPFWDINKGADVVLYGAGQTGKRFYEQNEKYCFCNIILWADQNYENLCIHNERIVSPYMIVRGKFDYIIIAVRSVGMVQEIVKKLVEMGVSAEKIVWNGVLIRKILNF